MPIYDVQCESCQHVFEVICRHDESPECEKCGSQTKRLITVSGHYVADENASWLPSVLDVVDKSNPAAHVQEFVKNPNRENYRRWMKGEGIKPADHTEHGGPPTYKPPSPIRRQEIVDFCYKRHRERQRIEIRGQR